MPLLRVPGACALLALMLLQGNGRAVAPPPTSTRELIERLQQVDTSDFGYSATVTGRVFLPLDANGELQTAMLMQPPPVPSAVMRELVQRGAVAVPLLVNHLRDNRPTRIIIRHPLGKGGPFLGRGMGWLNPLGGTNSPDSYTLTVGDLCYVALGQIINRDHLVAFYIPSGIVGLHSIASAPEEIASLTKEWSNLTRARHRAFLIREARKALDDETRIGACKRLAYYYPDALEALALELLALPITDKEDLLDGYTAIMRAKDTKERRRLFREFIADHGQAGRQALLRELFQMLQSDEEEPEILKDKDAPDVIRPVLVDLFGYGPKLRSADRPDFMTVIAVSARTTLIGEALIHDDSPKVDRVIRDLLRSTKDDELALKCMDRLVGRGFDADIERYCKRRLPLLEGQDKEAFEQQMARLGWTRLHVAVARGRVDLVPKLLARGLRPDTKARNGDTPLHLAVRSGNEEMLRLLLQAGVNLDGKDHDGLTAVQFAARNDNDSAAILLLKRDCAIPDILVAAMAGRADLGARFLAADPGSLRAQTEGERSLLFLAIRHGQTAVVRLLLDRKVDTRVSLDGGWTPLHEAAAWGQEGVALLLLKTGIPVDGLLKDSMFSTLHVAAINGRAGMARLLLDHGAKLDRVDSKGRSPLCLAAEVGQEEVVRLLLKKGASYRRVVKDGPYPLHVAAGGGHTKIMQLLLDAGADAEEKDPQTKETTLLIATGRGQLEAVRQLLDRGARINERDADGRTALYTAVEHGREDLVRLLLDRKADPNIANNAGATPLHAAAWFGRTELVPLLLDKGAVREARTDGGCGGTALHLTAQQGHIDTVRMLLTRKADIRANDGEGQNVLNTAIHWGKGEVVRLLLDQGAPIESSDGAGRTPLLTAISAFAWEFRGGEAMAKLLLERKAKIDGVSKNGQTPLHAAAQEQSLAAIAFLLDHKADINARETKVGRTPLHFAIEDGAGLDEPSESRALPAVRLLLERKADVTIKDARGRTPLALAIEMNYMKVAEMLRKHGAKK